MFTFINWPVRIQLLFLAILLTLPSLGIIIYSGLRERRDAFNSAARETQKLVDNIAAEQHNLVVVAQQLGSVIAELPDVKNGNAAKVQPILANIIKINPQFQNILIADRSGNALASAVPSNRHISVADRRYFKNAAATRRFSSGEYVIGRYTGKPMLTMGYPLVNAKGDFYGVVTLSFDLDRFGAVLKRSQLPQDANYIIVDHKGIIISRGQNAGQDVGRPIIAGQLQEMLAGPDTSTHVFTRVDGDERISTYRKLYLDGEQAPYMFVRAGMSLQSVIGDANQKLIYSLSILLAFVVIAFALSVFVGKRSIADRVGKLQQAAKRISGGDLQSRVADSVEGGELGTLGLAFDEMAKALEMRVAERQKAEEALAVKQLQLEHLNQSLEERIEAAIADLRQKDQILIQQSRLAAMGEMLNNIAHQWRQPLNNIGLIVQNLQDAFESGELTNVEMDRSIDNALDVIMHMSETIDDFRNFFRHDKEKQAFAVNEVVHHSIKYVEATLKSCNIEVDVTAEENVTTFGYQNEYSQVLLNIINNAKDVLLDRNVANPRICIRVFGEHELSVVTVRDNGGGIDAGILPKIFDPYFTTKDMTQGTGIGLYMSKVIIEKNMGGSLTACNIDGGAEFRIEV